jgi:hypothetical protein
MLGTFQNWGISKWPGSDIGHWRPQYMLTVPLLFAIAILLVAALDGVVRLDFLWHLVLKGCLIHRERPRYLLPPFSFKNRR